jgi:hypothetical protein
LGKEGREYTVDILRSEDETGVKVAEIELMIIGSMSVTER